VLRLRGELAQGEQAQVQDRVNDLLREGYKDFTVDLNDVSMDSAALGALVQVFASVSIGGGGVDIAGSKRLQVRHREALAAFLQADGDRLLGLNVLR